MTKALKPRRKMNCGKQESIVVYFETNACFQDTLSKISTVQNIKIQDKRDCHSGNVKIVFENDSFVLFYESGKVQFHTKEVVHTMHEVECILLQGIGYKGTNVIRKAKQQLREILVPTSGEELIITPIKMQRTENLDRVHLPPNFRYDGVQPGIGINVGTPVYVCDYCGQKYKSRTRYEKHLSKHLVV